MGPVRQNPIQRTVSLFICACIALCTIVAHNIAQNRPDSFPPYPPDDHHSSDDVYLREGGGCSPYSSSPMSVLRYKCKNSSNIQKLNVNLFCLHTTCDHRHSCCVSTLPIFQSHSDSRLWTAAVCHVLIQTCTVLKRSCRRLPTTTPVSKAICGQNHFCWSDSITVSVYRPLTTAFMTMAQKNLVSIYHTGKFFIHTVNKYCRIIRSFSSWHLVHSLLLVLH